jgi:hypothetical protein
MPARLAIRITNGAGVVVLDEPQNVEVTRFVAADTPINARPETLGITGSAKPDPFANKALRAAEYQYSLPLGSLQTGAYLLTFEATIGETTLRRDVQFVVK